MKKIICRTIVVLCMLTMAKFAIVAPAATAADLPELKLKVSQAMMPKTSLTHKLIEEFAANVTERTDGKVTFKIFGPEIGDWTELERMTKRGAVDMQFNAFDTGLDARWNFFTLPFMVSNWDQVRRVFSKGGIITELGEKWAEEKGLYYLGPWLNNLASLGMKEKVVTTEAQAKGLKIRVPPIDTYRCFVEKMGFSPVTIPWAEAPTAVATGLVDGWVGSGAVYMYDLFRDVAKVMIVTYDSPETWHVTYNLKKWNKLPEAYQTIITEEVEKVIIKHLDLVEKEEMDNQAKLVEAGWQIVTPTDAEMAAWKENCLECWDTYEDIVGKENIEKLLEEVNK
ncbi:MAG: TRAP transporter substrate-binding protein DctP [Desulfotignum sp.]|nr:TRAP transporter substrate-binding protein DctP [Desulfotignum sp.]